MLHAVFKALRSSRLRTDWDVAVNGILLTKAVSLIKTEIHTKGRRNYKDSPVAN